MEDINKVEEKERFTGKVVWFSKQSGIGFVAPDQDINNGRDLFVHFSHILMDGFKFICQDDIVSFTLGRNDKGQQCENVMVIKAAPRQERRRFIDED